MNPPLEPGTVHLCFAGLDLSPAELERLWCILSPDERDRAERFRFRRDRDRFVAGRGTLRLLLGRYLEADPPQLRFCHGPRGKPFLPPKTVGKHLRFNLAHSHGRVLYAFSLGLEVGVDLEFVQAGMEWEPIARRFLSPDQQFALFALPEKLRPWAFFTLWTRREALGKATGEGLATPLESMLLPVEATDVVAVEGGRHWSVRRLDIDPSYAAALAVEGESWEIATQGSLSLCQGRGVDMPSGMSTK